MEVTKHGKIDGACKGKNEWDNAIQGLAPHTLNISIVKVQDQDLVDMVELCTQLDAQFEYFHHELSGQGFRDCVQWFMKGEWC
jgi:molybdenum cofactor biosynthesis enzyme MoaA